MKSGRQLKVGAGTLREAGDFPMAEVFFASTFAANPAAGARNELKESRDFTDDLASNH